MSTPPELRNMVDRRSLAKKNTTKIANLNYFFKNCQANKKNVGDVLAIFETWGISYVIFDKSFINIYISL